MTNIELRDRVIAGYQYGFIRYSEDYPFDCYHIDFCEDCPLQGPTAKCVLAGNRSRVDSIILPSIKQSHPEFFI